jgi:thymidine phosphorylase
VAAGAPLAIVHARTDDAAARAVRDVAAAYTLADAPPAPRPLVLGVVDAPDG